MFGRIVDNLAMVAISIAMSIAMSVTMAITMAVVGISSSLEMESNNITLPFTCLCLPSPVVMSVEAITVSKAIGVIAISGIEGLRICLSGGLGGSHGLRCVRSQERTHLCLPFAMVATIPVTIAMTAVAMTVAMAICLPLS